MLNQEATEIIYELESEGHKLTKLRRAVIDIVSLRQQPLLLEELGRLLRDRLIQVHRTTLYRELVFLEQKQVIVPVVLADGKTRYEFSDRDHHHHLVCERCKKIEDIQLQDDANLQTLIKTKNNFKITKHTLEFFGLCGQCAHL